MFWDVSRCSVSNRPVLSSKARNKGIQEQEWEKDNRVTHRQHPSMETIACIVSTDVLCWSRRIVDSEFVETAAPDFPRYNRGLYPRVSEVVNAAMSSVIEYVLVVSCQSMRSNSVHCMSYLCSVAQYHVLRLSMLMRIVSQYSKSTSQYVMPNWKDVNPGNKKHYWQHIVEAKVELGPQLRLWDTELAEGCWKTVMKIPHFMSSKKESEKKEQMVNYMRDVVAVSELDHSIRDRYGRSKVGGSSRRKACTAGDNQFTVHHGYDVDELKFDSTRRRWMRADDKGDFESRYLHAVVNMECLNSFLGNLTEG